MQAITSSRNDSDAKQIEKDIADANERINSQRPQASPHFVTQE